MSRPRALPLWIPCAFFLSGFAALVYQVVWQRALYVIFGITIESVTIVVTAYLLGLGIGSLVGGAVAPHWPVLPLFGAAELGIAAFGSVSLALFQATGAHSSGASLATTGWITTALLLPPTLLMGMTLPLLVTHLVRLSGNVGRSVSMLYFVNTAGSGLAALATVAVLLPWLGMRGSVYVAVLCNVTVAAIVLIAAARPRA